MWRHQGRASLGKTLFCLYNFCIPLSKESQVSWVGASHTFGEASVLTKGGEGKAAKGGRSVMLGRAMAMRESVKKRRGGRSGTRKHHKEPVHHMRKVMTYLTKSKKIQRDI